MKQGVDVTANQDEIGEAETFQLEYDWSAHRWALRTTQVSRWGQPKIERPRWADSFSMLTLTISFYFRFLILWILQDRYWCLSNGSGIQATGNRRCADALFEMIWHGDGSVSFRANNGKFLATKRSGHLFSTSESIEEIAKFYFYLINRPILVLKCEQGFVGLKGQGATKLECNKAIYETILVERSAKGVVYFKGMTGYDFKLCIHPFINIAFYRSEQ